MQGGGIIEPGLTTRSAAPSTPQYTEEELNAMTKAQICALAEEMGYSISSSSATKSTLIAEFLTAQAGE